jgi:lipopolysaccharide biosynthesis protein
MEHKARVIAFYLPQYHPIPENDENWGKGFTEWTNVAQAKPLYKGHYQPRIPADLGFYDLRLPQVREAQAELARESGVEGFMYWHYWMGNGRMLLEKPLEEVVASGKPDFPFCYGWANHSWSTRTWVKSGEAPRDKMIAEQLYPGREDNIAHFNYCLRAFKDPRYIRVEGKPLFVIYAPEVFVGIKDFIDLWRKMAIENGLKGVYFVGLWSSPDMTFDDIINYGCDGALRSGRICAEKRLNNNRFLDRIKKAASNRLNFFTQKYDYAKVLSHMYFEENRKINCFPIITPGYDRTARAGKQARVYSDPNPTAFKHHVHETLKYIEQKDYDHRLLFLDSWNEWGEGNYMEPDTKWGHGFLNALKEEIVIE